MEKELIGVVVPVYKTEKYVSECIESILAQTYTHFRLILVDDGSPDNAGTICDKYAEKDNRITVIHQENAGVTRARARGVEEANDCEWITFVDSDDTIKEEALQLLYTTANKSNADIIISAFRKYTHISDVSIPIEQYRHYLFSEQSISIGPWGKLYKSSLFNNYTFDIPREIVIGEDLIMNIRLAFNTEKNIELIQQEIYNYEEYENSTFHSHIRTPQNEQAIHKNKTTSIPTSIRKDKYIISTIPVRLLRFREFWGYKYVVNEMKDTDFYINLFTDIKKYNYKIPVIDKLILNYSNPIIRFIAINLKKLINKL